MKRKQERTMTPFDDIAYIVNHVLLGDEPTIEDFILLVGTLVACIAFILWCCFPVQSKDGVVPHQKLCGKPLDAQLQQQNSSSNNYSKTIDYGIKNGHHCYT